MRRILPDDSLDPDDLGADVYRLDTDNFVGSVLSGLDLQNANLDDADLTGADLSNTNLSFASLQRANLTGANLAFATLDVATLDDAVFINANMIDVRMHDATLIGANLTDANLTDSDLSGADLTDADLKNVDLTRAKLNDTVLSNAYLTDATLMHTDLTDADFSGATLYHTQLIETKLSNVNLAKAHLFNTIFVRCNDIHNAKGIETIRHAGPSSLDASTLRYCAGHLPESFLSGVGYTEEEIETFRALYSSGPIQLNSCFISYSHKDEKFAQRLYSRLKQENIRVWYAPEDMQGGKKLHDQINQAIQFHDRLLLVLSENSLNSEWVMTEIRNARQQEKKEKRRKLFPIRLCKFESIAQWQCFDAESGKDLGVEVREYFIPDFSKWKKENEFEASFSRLLKDLQIADETKGQ